MHVGHIPHGSHSVRSACHCRIYRSVMQCFLTTEKNIMKNIDRSNIGCEASLEPARLSMLHMSRFPETGKTSWTVVKSLCVSTGRSHNSKWVSSLNIEPHESQLIKDRKAAADRISIQKQTQLQIEDREPLSHQEPKCRVSSSPRC